MSDPIQDALAAIEADGRRDTLAAACYDALRREYLEAAMSGDPSTLVRTPGDKIDKRSVLFLFQNAIDGIYEDAATEVLRTLAAAAKGEDVALRASALLSQLARDHAEEYADELAQGDES